MIKKERSWIRPISMAAARVGAAILGLFIQVWMVDVVGADAYGNYVAILTAASLAVIFLKSGADVVLLREISPVFDSGGSIYKFGFDFRKYFLSWFGVIFLVFLLIYGASFFDTSLFSRWNVWWSFSLAVFLSFYAVMSSVFRATKLHLLCDIFDGIIRPALFLGFIFVAGNFFDGGISIVVANIAAISFVFVAFLLIFIVNANKSNVSCARNELVGKDHQFWSSSLDFIIIALSAYAVFQLDTLILAAWVSDRDLGAYNMACNFIRLVIFVPMIFISLIQPKIAVYYKNNNLNKIKKIVKLSVVCGASFSALACFFLIIFGEKILLWVSHEFRSAYVAMVILSVGHFFNGVAMIYLAAVKMMAKEKILIRMQIFVGVVVSIGYMVIIPFYGMLGASVVATSAMILNFLFSFFIFKRCF